MSWLIFPWNYKIVAKQNVPRVAEKIVHFLRTKLTNEHFIYLIGHSLGAHIAGTAARTVATNGLLVDRITGKIKMINFFNFTIFKIIFLNFKALIQPDQYSSID